MALDLASLIAPGHTALLTQEIQRGVAGDLSPLRELADATKPILPNVVRLVEAARGAGVQVVHCVAHRRPDGRGANTNARIFQALAKTGPGLVPGSEAAELVPEIKPEESDIVMSRLHGLSPFQGTELDFVLRNLGVTTLVVVGVSVNVAIQNVTFDAVNASYQVVLPRDAVAGVPPEYAEQVLAHTLRNVATVTTTEEVLGSWERAR